MVFVEWLLGQPLISNQTSRAQAVSMIGGPSRLSGALVYELSVVPLHGCTGVSTDLSDMATF
jgi:hypothetical protein